MIGCRNLPVFSNMKQPEARVLRAFCVFGSALSGKFSHRQAPRFYGMVDGTT